MNTTTFSPFLEAEAAYHRDRTASDFRDIALRRQVRSRRRAQKRAVARRLATSQPADVR